MKRALVVAALATLTALAACGDPLFNFVGIWVYSGDSKVVQTCDGGSMKETTLVGAFSLGRDNTRLISPGANGCPPTTLNVTTPTTATIVPFSCTTVSSAGAKTVTDFKTLTVTTGDGQTMTLTGTGEITIDSPASHCTFTTTATATKQ